MMKLQNKVAIVTGAGRGIGKGIALDLAAQGAHVAVLDMNAADTQAVAAEIATLGVKSLALTCDVSKKTEIDAAIAQTMQELGSLDILVNNAGIYPMKALMEMTEDDWDKVIDVNLKGSFLFAQAAAKAMKDGSKIVCISSIASIIGYQNLVHYCASKGGMNSMVRAMALELASRKININAVAPGAIQTPGAGGDNSEMMKQIIPLIPLARVGQPADIAHAVTFLASDDANYITGQVLVVDGGWTLH